VSETPDMLAGKVFYYKQPTGFQYWWLIWVAAGVCVFLCGAILGLVTSGGGGWFGGILSPPFGGADRVSILMVGTDNATGRGLADTIIVAMVTPPTGEISAVSIPRDARVEVANVGYTRINASHSYGGLPLTLDTVQLLLGIPIDHYIEINVPGLVKLVDAIGGVEIDVEKRMRYTDRSQKLYINLQPGRQLLDGTQAMGYVRFRHDALGDIGRMERQRRFLHAVMQRLFSPEHVLDIPKMARIFVSTVNTDLTVRDIMALKDIIEMHGPEAIRTAALPAQPVRVGGASMLELDPEGVRETVEKVLLRQGVAVSVLNATAVEGLAARVAGELEERGCEVISIGNAERQSDRTLVIDHRNSARRAERVAAWLGKGVLSVDADGENPADVTVILGRDMLGGTQ